MTKKSVDDYYVDYLLGKHDNKEIKKQTLYQLYEPVKTDKGNAMPKFRSKADGMKLNDVHQVDILFLPNDDGYKYCLVVCDQATRLIDAEPLKNKNSESTLQAIKNIYNRKPQNNVILSLPKQLEFDSGTEFKGVFKTYLERNNIPFRVGMTGRHRQQALVERANQFIGTALLRRQQAQELLTKEVSRQWVKFLPILIKALNKRTLTRKFKPINNEVIQIKGRKWEEIIPIDTKVRVPLEEPYDITQEKRLQGKFRGGDVKWNPKIRTINNISLRPGYPVLYIVENDRNSLIAYTRNQIQIVKDDEQMPPRDIADNKYIIEKILDKRKNKNRIEYLVKWKDYNDENDNTWETRVELVKQVPDLVKEYEKTIK